jgi:hypothetical protein
MNISLVLSPLLNLCISKIILTQTNMIEQNKLDEAFSDHPPPHTDPHHAVNIPDSTSVDSTSPPIQGYPPNHQDFPSIVLYPIDLCVGLEQRLKLL